MVAVKAHQATAFLKNSIQKHSIFLLYGSDAGLISERSLIIAQGLAAAENPPGEILRFDDTDLENEPDRLVIELGTIPMFGGRKIVRVTTGRRINALALKPLIEGPPLAGVLIIEAGNLKPDDSLRAVCEKSASAAAIACYADEGQDIETLIRDTLRPHKMTIGSDALQLLASRLGADRALSRGEIDKLALYAVGETEITVEHIEAVVGDASEQALDRILNAAASGQSKIALAEFSRAMASGDSAQLVILSAERHFHKLHKLRAAIDGGRSFEDVARTLRPPLHFKQRDALSAQCRMWTAARLLKAIDLIGTAAKAARLASALEDAHGERLLLNIARLAGNTRA
jgi:DNA polymerase III subunit delta